MITSENDLDKGNKAILEYNMRYFKKEHPNKNDTGTIWFTDRDEAKAAADFIYKMGGWAIALYSIYEYYPWEGVWENIAY